MNLRPQNSRTLEPAQLPERIRTLIAVQCGSPCSDIQVHEVDGEIVLEGEVRRYYERQIAIACAQRVAGARRIVDRIAVR